MLIFVLEARVLPRLVFYDVCNDNQGYSRSFGSDAFDSVEGTFG